MDNRFSFLTAMERELLDEILARRRAALLERIRRAGAVAQSDAEEIVAVLSEELTDNLDDDWDPTNYGRQVSPLMGWFNASRVAEWERRSATYENNS